MKDKYIYDIGYDSYEGSEYIQMYFDKKLTGEELEKYVQEATITALTKALNDGYGKDAFIFWGLERRGITFQDLFDYIIKELENKGFERVNFDSSFSCFGWTSIVQEEDWDYAENSSIDRLVKVIPNELKIRALEKAGRQEEEINNDK